MEIPVFVSCSKAYLQRQEAFLVEVERALVEACLRPMTLGRSEYSIDAPLEAIRRLMTGSFGLITLAFRRSYVEVGTDRPMSDLGEPEVDRSKTWLSSPYCQIEPAMAYQLGIPVLIWREDGVSAEGLLDRGAVGLSMPAFDLDTPPNLSDRMWRQPFQEWIDRVRSTHRKIAAAPRLW